MILGGLDFSIAKANILFVLEKQTIELYLYHKNNFICIKSNTLLLLLSPLLLLLCRTGKKNEERKKERKRRKKYPSLAAAGLRSAVMFPLCPLQLLL